ncbi:hypothetical protein F2Q68_00043146 [Brassica cretica]|uniref:Uncharacterized protein n=1 Tax=Brassica cretica TaxID=69181 RepID=A0A8S9LGE3_BRACR|nr:hypothetical protein F2Q68_00043146 [Brassica cretica]
MNRELDTNETRVGSYRIASWLLFDRAVCGRTEADVASCPCWIRNARQLLSGFESRPGNALVVCRERAGANRERELRLKSSRIRNA